MAPAAALREAAERATRDRSASTDVSGEGDDDEEQKPRRGRPPTLRNIEDMPEAEFDALSEADKRRLRGD